MAGFIKDRRKLTLVVGAICLVALAALFFINRNHSDNNKNNDVKNGIASAPQETSLEDAVSAAVKKSGKGYLGGEFLTEGHIILDTEKKESELTVYTIASVGWFGFENGIFTKVSGSGAIPTVISFTQNNAGEYLLRDYEEPLDGSYYAESIKKMFPEKLQPRVLSDHKDNIRLRSMQEQQAAEYLKSIGRKAKVSIDYVEKTLPDIATEASNKLFAEYTKYDSFLNNCPYWLGTREKMENGVRYIYKTSQSKTSDGCDLITFSKTRDNGVVIEESSYKIVAGNPRLVD